MYLPGFFFEENHYPGVPSNEGIRSAKRIGHGSRMTKTWFWAMLGSRW